MSTPFHHPGTSRKTQRCRSAVVPPRIVAWSIRTCVSLPLSAPPKWHLATNGPTRLLDKHLLFDRLGRGLVAAFHGIGTPSAFPKPVPPPVSFSGLILFRIFCSSRSCLFSSSHLWPKCDPMRAWPSNSRRSSALLSINPRRIRDSHQPKQTSTQHQGISSQHTIPFTCLIYTKQQISSSPTRPPPPPQGPRPPPSAPESAR